METSGRVLLLSSDNTIIGVDDHSLLGQNFADIGVSKNILSKLDAPDNAVVKYEMNGTDRMGTVSQLSGGGWKVIAAMDLQEYNSETSNPS